MSGTVEPTDSDCEWESSEDEDDDEEMEEEKKEVNALAVSPQSGEPSFSSFS